MEKTKSRKWWRGLDSLALFDQRFFPFPWIFLYGCGRVFDYIPISRSHNPWYQSLDLLIFLIIVVGLELALRRWPAQLSWPTQIYQRVIFIPAKAWDIKSLLFLICLFAIPLVLLNIPHGPTAMLGAGVGCVIFIAFCWVFMSLAESWERRFGETGWGGGCFFVVLMAVASYGVGCALIWMTRK